MMPHVIQIPGLAVMEPRPITDPEILRFLDESQDGVIVSIIPKGDSAAGTGTPFPRDSRDVPRLFLWYF